MLFVENSGSATGDGVRIDRNAAIPYSREALRHDLARIREAWEDCRASRERDAIYDYLEAVYGLVAWWRADRKANGRARRALLLSHMPLMPRENAFAAVIRCTADCRKVDKRTRSKWSRAMRYAAKHKPLARSLRWFIKKNGGINRCAARFARH